MRGFSRMGMLAAAAGASLAMAFSPLGPSLTPIAPQVAARPMKPQKRRVTTYFPPSMRNGERERARRRRQIERGSLTVSNGLVP